MIKKIKELYNKWRNRNQLSKVSVHRYEGQPEGCCYIVAFSPDELGLRIKVESVHKTLESANRSIMRQSEGIRHLYVIQKYGLWD